MGKTNFLRICWFWIEIAIQFQGKDFLGLCLIALLKDCALRHLFAQRREEIGFCHRATPQCPGDWFCWPSHTVRILSLESCQALPCLEDCSAQNYWHLGASQLWGCPGLCRMGAGALASTHGHRTGTIDMDRDHIDLVHYQVYCLAYDRCLRVYRVN